MSVIDAISSIAKENEKSWALLRPFVFFDPDTSVHLACFAKQYLNDLSPKIHLPDTSLFFSDYKDVSSAFEVLNQHGLMEDISDHYVVVLGNPNVPAQQVQAELQNYVFGSKDLLEPLLQEFVLIFHAIIPLPHHYHDPRWRIWKKMEKHVKYFVPLFLSRGFVELLPTKFKSKFFHIMCALYALCVHRGEKEAAEELQGQLRKLKQQFGDAFEPRVKILRKWADIEFLWRFQGPPHDLQSCIRKSEKLRDLFLSAGPFDPEDSILLQSLFKFYLRADHPGISDHYALLARLSNIDVFKQHGELIVPPDLLGGELAFCVGLLDRYHGRFDSAIRRFDIVSLCRSSNPKSTPDEMVLGIWQAKLFLFECKVMAAKTFDEVDFSGINFQLMRGGMNMDDSVDFELIDYFDTMESYKLLTVDQNYDAAVAVAESRYKRALAKMGHDPAHLVSFAHYCKLWRGNTNKWVPLFLMPGELQKKYFASLGFPQHSFVFIALEKCHSLIAANKFQEAKAEAESALSYAKTNKFPATCEPVLSARAFLSHCMNLLGDREGEEAALGERLNSLNKLNYEYLRAFKRLVELQSEASKFAEIEAACKKLISETPDEEKRAVKRLLVTVNFTLGQALASQEQDSEAIAAFEKTLTVLQKPVLHVESSDPMWAATYLEISKLHLKAEHWHDAELAAMKGGKLVDKNAPAFKELKQITREAAKKRQTEQEKAKQEAAEQAKAKKEAKEAERKRRAAEPPPPKAEEPKMFAAPPPAATSNVSPAIILVPALIIGAVIGFAVLQKSRTGKWPLVEK